jgi:hypothetical protein
MFLTSFHPRVSPWALELQAFSLLPTPNKGPSSDSAALLRCLSLRFRTLKGCHSSARPNGPGQRHYKKHLLLPEMVMIFFNFFSSQGFTLGSGIAGFQPAAHTE